MTKFSVLVISQIIIIVHSPNFVPYPSELLQIIKTLVASHLQTRHSQCEPMLAVLDCLRRLQTNLTELTLATQQCISAE